jgi:hypothetical protein
LTIVPDVPIGTLNEQLNAPVPPVFKASGNEAAEWFRSMIGSVFDRGSSAMYFELSKIKAPDEGVGSPPFSNLFNFASR